MSRSAVRSALAVECAPTRTLSVGALIHSPKRWSCVPYSCRSFSWAACWCPPWQPVKRRRRGARRRIADAGILRSSGPPTAGGRERGATGGEPAAKAPGAGKPKYTGFSSPTGLAYGRDGSVYVSNWSAGTVERITRDGKRSVHVKGLEAPAGLAVDRQGALYIADYNADVVYRAPAAGKLEKFASGFHTPTGISFDSRQNLLVTNRASNELMSVSPDGRSSRVADGLRTPVGVVEAADGTIYVSNYEGGVLSRVTRDGTVETHSKDFDGLGVGIVADKAGSVFVTDRTAGEIKRVARMARSRPC